MRRTGSGSAVAVGLCLLASGAHAEESAAAPDSDEARAVELFEAGERAYFAGDYEQAIFHLEQAVELRPNPVLFYNLARSYERADRIDEAIRTYRKYLDANPEAADRKTIEARIASLERERVERAASEARVVPDAPPPAPPPSEAEPEARTASAPPPAVRGAGALPWVVAGVGALGIGAGAGLWVVASSSHDKAEAEPSQGRAHDLQSQAEDLAMAGNVTVVAGGVVLVAGLLWGVLDVTEEGGGEHASGWRLRVRGGSIGVEAPAW